MTPLLAIVLIICHTGCAIMLLGLGRMAYKRGRRVLDARHLIGVDDTDRFILKKAFRRDLLYLVCALCFTLIPLSALLRLEFAFSLTAYRALFYGGFLSFLGVFALNVVLDNVDEARLTNKIADAKDRALTVLSVAEQAVDEHEAIMHEGEVP